MQSRLIGLGAAVLALAACTRSTPTAAITPTPTIPAPTAIAQEHIMVVSVKLTHLEWSKSYYHPGEPVELTVHVATKMEHPVPARLSARITFLEQPVVQLDQQVTLSDGEQDFTISWNPPPLSPRGYGLDLSLQTTSGDTLASAQTAFDILQRWTQMPRYGFLTDFAPGRADATETMSELSAYHINALQFYDWMYRHDQFLTDQEPYLDPLGRKLSRLTVDQLITAAHARGIACMPYTAVYAASMDFYHQHPDWAMRGSDGKTLFFGENFLVYMDPRPDSPWTRYLLDQFDQVLKNTAFDGIHLDQYGDPKLGYDAQGQPYALDTVLADFIDLTHQRVTALRPDGAVVFNAVTNWPIQKVAPAEEDIVYIEVWPPYTTFAALEQLIVQGQSLGKGKAVVLAAYIDPFLEHNVRLMDAIIFASGGGHIELGEKNAMLADAYFPRYGKMSSALVETMRRYYEFAMRYQNVTGPEAHDATGDYLHRISVQGVSTNLNQGVDIVMTIVRESEGYTAVNLVNLLGLPSAEWRSPLPADPRPLGKTAVSISGLKQRAAALWVASPDGEDGALQAIPFVQAGDQLSFEIPSLEYWDMILVKWEGS